MDIFYIAKAVMTGIAVGIGAMGWWLLVPVLSFLGIAILRNR